MWDAVVPALSADCRVVRLDLLGHGGAEDPAGERVLGDFVEQLHGVIDLLDEPVDLVGSSLGALISFAFTATHPQSVRSLVVSNMVFGRTGNEQSAVDARLALAEDQGMSAIADLAIDRWFDASWQSAHPDVVAAIRTRLSTTDLTAYLKAYRVFVSTDARAAGYAEQITCPTLAMTGELDPASTPAMTSAIAEAVAAGQAEVLVGLHHLPSVEAPERFVDSLNAFHSSLDTESNHV